MSNISPKEAIIEWIDHILERRKWNGTDLARAADLAPSTILRLINNPRHTFIPSLKTLQKIADASGYPIPRKVTEATGAASIEPPTTPDDPPSGRRYRAAIRLATVPVRYVSSLPASLQAPAPSRETYVQSIPALDGDDTLFAFYMPDSSLEPLIKAGTLMFASKRRDPINGDLVFISDKDGRVRVRCLMSIDSEGLKLSKTLPAKVDEAMDFEQIAEVAIVLADVRS